MAAAKATIDHEIIRVWVESRGGRPSCVKGTGRDDDPGIVRIAYSDDTGHVALEPISWGAFFRAFDANALAFLYHDDEHGHFCKLVSRTSVDLVGAPTFTRKPRHAIGLLETQHREIEALFAEYHDARDLRGQKRVFEKIADAFAAHAKIEETIFYPEVMTEATEDELREAVEEHLAIKRTIADLMEIDPGDDPWGAKMALLQEQVAHHIQEEETKIFALVENFEDDDFRDMGARMSILYEDLMDGEPRWTVPNETDQAARL